MSRTLHQPGVTGAVRGGPGSVPKRAAAVPSRPVPWLGFVLPGILLLGWEAASRFGWLDPTLFSSPGEVLAELQRLIGSGALWVHLQITLGRVFMGFALGLSTATVLGVLTGCVPLLRALVDPLLQALRSVPSMAWVPLFILWLGIQEASKVTLIGVGVFFPIYLSLMNGIRNVDRKLVEAGLAFGFRGVGLVYRIVFPACLPGYLLGVRHALSLGWMFVVAAEIMGASRGLGYLLIDGQTTGRPARILVSVLLFAVCGKITDGAMAALCGRALHWQDVYPR